MYRANAAPPPPVPEDVTRQAVKTCALMQLGVAAIHAITFLSLAVHFGFYKPPPVFHVDPELLHQIRMGALLGGIGYVLLFAIWGGINAWGLGRRSKVARWSSIAWAGATMATCLALPFGGFLLYTLLRRDVKAYFE